MAKVFYIENTDGSISFKLAPGTYDGPGAPTRRTDLRLYGLGFMEWGEGVDENFLRVMENFACGEKVAGSYNPDTQAFDYDPITQGLKPLDEHDLGFGQGINFPVNGQTWYNTSAKQIYVYDLPNEEWIPIGGSSGGNTIIHVGTTPPGSPNIGDLWYNTSVLASACTSQYQLMIWDGVAWNSVADRYVLKSGDTMCGPLTITGQNNSVVPNLTARSNDGALVFIETSTLSATAPSVLFHNYDNNPTVGGSSGTYGYARASMSAGSILKIEADTNPFDTTDSAVNVLTITQAGDMNYYGVSGGNPKVIKTLNASIPDIDLHPKTLVTQEYLQYYFGLIGGGGGGAMTDPVKIGTTIPFAGTNVPDKWLLCFGQAVSRTDYAELFAVIGTTYGVGDGSSTFNLPDLRGRAAIGLDNMGGVSANVVTNTLADAIGGKLGEENHVLTTSEMPSHTHSGSAASGGDHTHSGTTSTTGSHVHTGYFPQTGGAQLQSGSGWSNNFLNTSAAGDHSHTVSITSGGAHTHTLTLDSAGSGAAHNNMQPSMALNWIIKAKPELVTIAGDPFEGLTFVPVYPNPVVADRYITSGTGVGTPWTSPTYTITFTSPPERATHVMLRIYFNTNALGNNTMSAQFRTDAGDIFTTKVTMDPTLNSGSVYEGENYATFVMPFDTVVNTVQYQVVDDRGDTASTGADTIYTGVYLEGYFIQEVDPISDFVHRAGDTMYGPLTMTNNADITLSRDPTMAMHATTKQYVDALVASMGGVNKLFSWGSFSTR